jgi:hypothetical protein
LGANRHSRRHAFSKSGEGHSEETDRDARRFREQMASPVHEHFVGVAHSLAQMLELEHFLAPPPATTRQLPRRRLAATVCYWL